MFYQRKAIDFLRNSSNKRYQEIQSMLTEDSNDPKLKEGQQNLTGQHDIYLVLSEEERAKDFVRPYRDKYVHTGRKVCGHMISEVPAGILESSISLVNICVLPPPLEGEVCDHNQWQSIKIDASLRARYKHLLGGCGVETKMGQALSETYARQPSFYGATFCVGCDRHLPVEEFTWSRDGQIVGS